MENLEGSIFQKAVRSIPAISCFLISL